LGHQLSAGSVEPQGCIKACTFFRTESGVFIKSPTSISSVSPLTSDNSIFSLSASMIRSRSLITCSKLCRSKVTRSFGVSGGATIGRPNSTLEENKRSKCFCSSVLALQIEQNAHFTGLEPARTPRAQCAYCLTNTFRLTALHRELRSACTAIAFNNFET
jgi:hypothetical protein